MFFRLLFFVFLSFVNLQADSVEQFSQNALTPSELVSKQISKNEVILLHGTFASQFPWYKPGGDFYESVKVSASKRFGKDNFIITPFTWSGMLGCSPRIEAATNLAEYLIGSNNKIYIFGHSHGGTVIVLASILLELLVSAIPEEERLLRIQNLAVSLTAKSLQENERWVGLQRSEKVVDSATEVTKLLNNSLVRLEGCLKKKRTKGFSEDNFFDSQFLIEENFLSATPVDDDVFAPSCKVIRQSYSLYSNSDLIQPAFGLYEKTFNASDKVVINLCTYLAIPKGSKSIFLSPSHSEMHSPRIGRYLLQVPLVCDQLNAIEYAKQKKADIIFYQDSLPNLESPEITTSFLATLVQNFQDFTSMFYRGYSHGYLGLEDIYFEMTNLSEEFFNQ